MAERLHSKAESDRWTNVYYEASVPRKRDFLRVLLGRWTPEVRRVERLTPEGYQRVLKEVWTGPKMVEQFYAESPLVALFENREAEDG